MKISLTDLVLAHHKYEWHMDAAVKRIADFLGLPVQLILLEISHLMVVCQHPAPDCVTHEGRKKNRGRHVGGDDVVEVVHPHLVLMAPHSSCFYCIEKSVASWQVHFIDVGAAAALFGGTTTLCQQQATCQKKDAERTMIP